MSRNKPTGRRRSRRDREDDRSYIVRAESAFEFKDNIADRWTPEHEVPGTRLSRLVGLERLKVSVVRIPSGGEASVYHSYHREEEWAFVLKGRGVVVINDIEYIVGPGDFVGFPAKSDPHHVRNPFEHSMVCLVGGENMDIDVADFPRQGKRLFRYGEKFEVYDPNEAEESAPSGVDELLMEHWPGDPDEEAAP